MHEFIERLKRSRVKYSLISSGPYFEELGHSFGVEYKGERVATFKTEADAMAYVNAKNLEIETLQLRASGATLATAGLGVIVRTGNQIIGAFASQDAAEYFIKSVEEQLK